MSFIEMEQTIACQQMEIDDLRAKLKEAQAEIERLKEENIAFACNLRGKHAITGATYEILCTQLAASQARISELEMKLAASQACEVQLRKALYGLYLEFERTREWGCLPIAMLVAKASLSLPSDTTALEAMIQKAGEVMRERCAKVADWQADGSAAAVEIRALPGVTLEDLK